MRRPYDDPRACAGLALCHAGEAVEGRGGRSNGQSLKAVHASPRDPRGLLSGGAGRLCGGGRGARESAWPSEEQFGRRVVEAILTRQEELAPQQGAKMLDLVGQFADDRTRALANRLKGSLSAVA